MKKYLQLIIVFCFIAFYSTNTFSQSVQVKSGPMFGEVNDLLYTIDSKTGDKIFLEQSIANLTLKNTTDKLIKFKMSVQMIELTMGHEISVCWNVCLPPFHDNYTSPQTYQLEPNQITTEGLFSVHLYPYMLISDNPPTYSDPVAGKTVIKITFVNVDDANDKYDYNLTFNISDPSPVVEVANITNLEIMDITPNPAMEQTHIMFSNLNGKDASHLEIYDMQGNLVMNKDLSDNANDVTVDTSTLSGGSYYCRLISGSNFSSKVKTLIVKR